VSIFFRSRDLFFRNGWGDPSILNELSDPALLSGPATPVAQVRFADRPTKLNGLSKDVEFLSPMSKFLPEESKMARLRIYLPKNYTKKTPLTLIFAMTGDAGFKNRIFSFSKDLLNEGIGTVLLENSYYGFRRPKDQKSYMLNHVQDMLAMSIASVQEGKSILHWLREKGFENLGVSGVSQGGMVASVVGAVSPEPVSIAASLAAHSPEVIFTEGLLRTFVDWKALGFKKPSEGAKKFRELFQGGDVTQLKTPNAPSRAYLQGAKRDLVVPSYSVKKIHENWPGSKLSWLPGTHVSSLALHSRGFRKLISSSFA
jgi:hypothetical protein